MMNKFLEQAINTVNNAPKTVKPLDLLREYNNNEVITIDKVSIGTTEATETEKSKMYFLCHVAESNENFFASHNLKSIFTLAVKNGAVPTDLVCNFKLDSDTTTYQGVDYPAVKYTIVD